MKKIGRQKSRASKATRQFQSVDGARLNLGEAFSVGPLVLVTASLMVMGVGNAIAESLGFLPFLGEHQLSFDAYRAMAHDPAVRASLGETVRIAGASTVGAVGVGVGAALALRSLGSHWRWLRHLIALNLGVSHLVGAFAVLLLLSQSGLVSRIGHGLGVTPGISAFPVLTNDDHGVGVIVELIWKESVFVTFVVLSALNRGVERLEVVASTLGAGRWQRFRLVTVPLVAPALAVSIVLVFVFIVGSYEVPYVLGRSYPAMTSVVALQYYRDVDLHMRSIAMAIMVTTTVASLLVVAMVAGLLRTMRAMR